MVGFFKRIKEYFVPPMTVERGRKCANELLAENPSQEEIDCAYMCAMDHRDDFDKGWCETLKPRVSADLLNMFEP